MEQSCPRCGLPFELLDRTVPAFCPHCGLPQLRVSEDVLATDTSLPGNETRTQGDGVLWGRALGYIGIAAIVGVAGPCLLPGALTSGAVAGICLLLTPALTIAVVFAYQRRLVDRVVSPAAGVHMGAVLGLFMGALIAMVTGITGFVLRYGYHSHVMDEKIQQATAQMPAQISAAGPPPPQLLALLRSPEFRAGTFILGHVFSLLLLVGIGALCGWMAAAMLRGRRQRNID